MYKAISLVAVIVSVVAIIIALQKGLRQEPAPLGGVTVGNEYVATTLTPSSSVGGVIKNHPATLGSVIITGSSGGALTIYNATTTNVNLRTGQTATSSLDTLAAFGASQTVGTYVFDILASTGLVYEWTGSVSTSTITSR